MISNNIVSILPILVAVFMIGLTAGMLGIFLLLRKESMLGDAISHAALPGIAVTFLFTQTKNVSYLLFGGVISSIVGLLSMFFIIRHTRLKVEAVLGIILSVFFGIGLVMISIIQKNELEHQGVINKFLFGNAATLIYSEILMIVVCTMIILSIYFFVFRQLLFATLDPLCAHVVGYNKTLYDFLLFALLIVIIALGLQTMGVILISSMLIAPAASARQWSSHATSFVCLSGLFGGIAAVIGTMISVLFSSMPTGPLIVIVLSCILFFSIFFAPHRGLLWN